MVRSIVNWRRTAREVFQTSAEAEVTPADAILSCRRTCLRWRTNWGHCHFVLFVLDRCQHRFWPGIHNLHNWVNHDTDILWQCDLATANVIWVIMCLVDWQNQFAKVCDFSFGLTNSGVKHIHRQGTTTWHRGHLWKNKYHVWVEKLWQNTTPTTSKETHFCRMSRRKIVTFLSLVTTLTATNWKQTTPRSLKGWLIPLFQHSADTRQKITPMRHSYFIKRPF